MRAAQGFAINGDDLTAGQWAEILHPIEEALLERLWLKAGKETAKGIVGRYTVWQLEEGVEPVFFGLAKQLNLFP